MAVLFDLPTDNASSHFVWRGIVGAVVSLAGSAVLCVGSVRHDWSSAAVVIGLFLCGVVGLYCGGAEYFSGRRSVAPQTRTQRLLTGISLVAGTVSTGVAFMVVMVMWLLFVLASR